MTTADVQQQLFSVLGLKETSRVEDIDTAGARCASVKVWVGARGERACGERAEFGCEVLQQQQLQRSATRWQIVEVIETAGAERVSMEVWVGLRDA